MTVDTDNTMQTVKGNTHLHATKWHFKNNSEMVNKNNEKWEVK